MSTLPSFIRCPQCQSSLAGLDRSNGGACLSCGWTLESVDGVPILVRDLVPVRAAIDAARRAGRTAWYDRPHAAQFTGPYRHHLQKRRDYVEGVLREFAVDRTGVNGLDLGCGDGENFAWLSRYADVLHASDYNLGRLTRAVSRGLSGAVFLADVTDYPSGDGAFDFVYCNHVLEHVADDGAALAEVARILRPDGIAILGVPNEGAAFWRLAYALEPWSRRRTDHVHFYTADSIAARCEQVGLHVRHIERLGWGLPNWTLDAAVRRFSLVDDVLERIGRRWVPGQATSLYVIAQPV